MKFKLEDLRNNTKEDVKIGNLENFREDENDLIKLNPMNQLNDLNLLEWIRHTKTVHLFSKKVPFDKYKSFHPATFEEELPYYYIEFFSKKNNIIFDPFLGSGTTSIAAHLLGRKSIGIEINKKFIKIAQTRCQINELNLENHRIIEGDCYSLLKSGKFRSYFNQNKLDFTITSPPYWNMLKDYRNKKNEIFKPISNYGSDIHNLENVKDYNQYLMILTEIFEEIYKIMKNKSYLLINLKNFYKQVDYKNGKKGRQIIFFAWDLAKKLCNTNWIPCGEQIWVYPNKRLYPFGSPYVYIANIAHSYNLIFYKDTFKK